MFMIFLTILSHLDDSCFKIESDKWNSVHGSKLVKLLNRILQLFVDTNTISHTCVMIRFETEIFVKREFVFDH